MKQVNSSKGKSIEIYDDLFDLKYRNLIYDYISTSRFKIGWSDTTISEKAQYRNLHSATQTTIYMNFFCTAMHRQPLTSKLFWV